MRKTFGAVIIASLALAGCPEDPKECAAGSDCPSGACTADGACVPLDDAKDGPDWNGGSPADGEAGVDASGDGATGSGTADAGPGAGDDGKAPPADTAQDSGSSTDSGPPPDTTSGVCSPNGDGIVTRAEMPIAAGLHASYKVAADVTWSTAGADLGDGAFEWDLSGTLPGDTSALVEARPLEGTWFEADFPDATYAARLSETQNLLGVFRVTDDGLFLQGVVSIEDSLTATNLAYDPPVQVLKFPVEQGMVWKTDSTVTGAALGVWSMYTEKYRSEVDAHGTLKTPFADFPVLRINVELTRTIGVFPVTLRTHMFIAECFGTVGSVVSQDNETGAEFEDVSELRRLAP